ncbi:MAG: hypothetical protein GXW99_06985 [Clostridiales bacterium]|nr:hypothetical protein [Clostridiales bacterium]
MRHTPCALTDEQKTYLIGKEYEAQKKTVGGDRGTERDAKSGKFTAIHQKGGERDKDYGTSGIVAKAHGIGKSSVERAERFSKGLDLNPLNFEPFDIFSYGHFCP